MKIQLFEVQIYSDITRSSELKGEKMADFDVGVEQFTDKNKNTKDKTDSDVNILHRWLHAYSWTHFLHIRL